MSGPDSISAMPDGPGSREPSPAVSTLRASIPIAAVRDLIHAAYIEGATDVHNYWAEVRPDVVPRGDPEFGEQASDYTASVNLEEYQNDLSPDDGRVVNVDMARAGELVSWPADFIPAAIAELERDNSLSTAEICKVFAAMKRVAASAMSTGTAETEGLSGEAMPARPDAQTPSDPQNGGVK